jgi:4-hydroxy-tetrahydrodipicolinate synthase
MSDRTQLKGCGTALITPFQADGRLDEAALKRLVEFQISEGIDFLVPCGTTGESATLTVEEHLRVVEIVINQSNGRVAVIAGAGGNNTQKVIQLAKECERLGANGILSVTPYYNKPTPEGLVQHFRAIAEAISLPIIVYNVPGRTSLNVEPETLVRLSQIDNVIGVKEASGNITQMAEVLTRVPDDFAVLSGDDAVTVPLMALGGVGVISVASNEVPGPMSKLARFCLEGNFDEARRLNKQLFQLMKLNFIETNPIPVKAALAMMGHVEEVYRLPLVPMKPENKDKLRSALAQLGLVPAAAHR